MTAVGTADAAGLTPGQRDAARIWWLVVLTGVVSIVFGFIVLSFTLTTVWAVAIWAGCGMILTGCAELMVAGFTDDHRWLHILMGSVAILAGLIAFFWPQETFLVLARLVGWLLLFRGISHLFLALEVRHSGDESSWGLTLAIGIIEIATALWAVRYPGRSIVLLVLWVGLTALLHGVAQVVLGFQLRSLRHEP